MPEMSSSFDAFVKSVQTALADLGAERFDYLVNNAGTSHHNAFEKTTEEELDGLYNVHFKGVFFLTQKLLPLINDGGTDREHLLGPDAHSPFREAPPMRSMKGAVEVLTRYLAKELGAARDRGQYRRPRRHRDRFQRRHGPRQSRSQQARRGHDGAWPRRPARRHRPDDRLAAFRG